jgi:regulator-associated protein of mTOR
MRAKSDFGPRRQHQEEPAAESTDEAGSADGHFKIRHGWDDQLNSEEYNNLLTSVRSTKIAAVP